MAGVLWSVAPKLVFFLVGYAVIGTWLTASVFGRRLTVLIFRLLKCEGDLRFDLVRVRENAGKHQSRPWWQCSAVVAHQLHLVCLSA